MTWRDELRRVQLADGRELIGASFRGVPFFVDSSDRRGGRRTVTHEFWGRDDPSVDDGGRRARAFSVEGYVVGDDYLRDRDALLTALEDVAGAGELVHPYHGVRRAICTGLTVRESRVDGGMATFSLQFAEAPAPSVPTEVVDLAEQVTASATIAIAATEAEFVESYDVAGQPAFATESLAGALDGAAAELGAALSGIVDSTQDMARLSAEVAVLSSDAASLVREPTGVLGAFLGAVRALGEAVRDTPLPVLRALLDVYATVQVTAALGTTATRELERANQAALTAALRRLLVIEAARLIVLVEYETLEDATADASMVAELLEDQAELAGNAAYPALVALRTHVLRAVPGDAALARVLTVERRVATPSLLLAYELYGSVEREADLIARNGVSHPGFLAGDLRVLSDG